MFLCKNKCVIHPLLCVTKEHITAGKSFRASTMT